MTRRTIGHSTEWTPAERVGRWISENITKFAGCIISVILFCLLVNIIVNKFINFLALGTAMERTEDLPYSADNPIAIVVKILGSVLIIWLFFQRRPTT